MRTITPRNGMQISDCAEPCLQTGTVNPTTESFWALVLAGGDGTRLQGVTRVIAGAPIPKQYCRILGSRSLLETTLRRIAPLVAAERTLAIINRDHLTIARPQLTNLDVRNVLVQPRNLDTGPGLLVGMLELARRDPEATVAIFPSDHYIRDGAAFRRSVERMRHVVAAHPEKIALLGARPEHVDTGYGYITPGRPVAPGADTFAVRAFHEKPAADLAAAIIRRGALWNSFVMVARARRVLELLRALRPHDVALLEDVPIDGATLATVYDRLQPWNFSRGFLSRVPEHLVVNPCRRPRVERLGYARGDRAVVRGDGPRSAVAGTRRSRLSLRGRVIPSQTLSTESQHTEEAHASTRTV